MQPCLYPFTSKLIDMPSTLPVAKQLILHSKLFINVLDGITDAQAEERINNQTNHLKWIAGHLTNIRYNISTMAGVPKNFPFADKYVDQTQPPPFNRKLNETIVYPTIEELKACWKEISPIFTNAITNLTEEQLAIQMPFNIPTGNSFFDALSFLGSHEAYHIGQMSTIRRFLGLSAMSYM